MPPLGIGAHLRELSKKVGPPQWVTLWLAVPRSGPYESVAKLWDEEFRSRKAFRLLSQGDDSAEVSIRNLEELGRGKNELYVAPLNLRKVSPITQQAVRVLRNSGEVVIQGVDREESFLRETTLVGASTGDLLVRHFKERLPKLVQVESIQEKVIKRDALLTLFDDKPLVQIVRLGSEAAAVLPVENEIWVNIDSSAGREVVKTVCARNEGHMGLWIACMRHAGQHAPQIANLLRGSSANTSAIGPIKRQYVLRMVE